jgi:hypothetical protein
MGCNCNQPTPCNPAPQSCDCPTILETKCSIYEGNDLECSGIKKGTILTELIQQLDAFICKVREDLINAFTLKNIGTGASVYKGVDLLGRKEIRKINAVGDLATVTQNANDISVSINEANLDTFIEANQKTYTVANVGTGAQAYKDSTVVGNNTQFNLKKLRSNAGTVVITELTNEINFEIEPIVTDIDITAGANVTVTEPTLNNFIITATDTIALLENSPTTTVTGNGTIGDEYQVDVNNLQKVVNIFPYTLLNSDDKYTIFLENGASNVVVNVPDTLSSNFSVAFIQKGTGDITTTPTGTSIINTAVGYKIKGQYYWTLLEKEQTTVNYYLIGSTKL